jgi:hypothetical protein
MVRLLGNTMAHYAFLDENNMVTYVMTGKDEGDGDYDWEEFYGNELGQTCKRTSYNTYGGQHLLGGTPYRKNYAGYGYYYDEQRDAFVPPKPYPSWVLNEATCLWTAPVAHPDDNKSYTWDETQVTWVEINT